MMKWFYAPAALVALSASSILAEDYRVEAFKDVPAPKGVSADVAAQLSTSGFKVLEGDKRVVCEIWPAKTWTAKADFEPSDTILYALEPGSLVGVLRFPRKGADFRGQEIAAGAYTLRYGDQPVDGNHVGTFDTRDFLLLLPAAADESTAALPEAELFEKSAQAAGSTHPAIWPLVKPAGDGAKPTLRHIEEKEWWTVCFGGQDAGGKKLALELIVVGKAAE